MWWLWFLPAAILVVVVIVWIVRSSRVYNKVFSDAHCHEVADKLPALKEGAVTHPILSEQDAPKPPADPRFLLTSVGLALVYTIRPDGEQYQHHLSVSLATHGYTAHAVGDMFIRLLAHLLGVEMSRLQLAVSSSTVHHAVFTLSREEHEEYAMRPVALLTSDGLAKFREEWTASLHTVQWERLP